MFSENEMQRSGSQGFQLLLLNTWYTFFFLTFLFLSSVFLVFDFLHFGSPCVRALNITATQMLIKITGGGSALPLSLNILFISSSLVALLIHVLQQFSLAFSVYR